MACLHHHCCCLVRKTCGICFRGNAKVRHITDVCRRILLFQDFDDFSEIQLPCKPCLCCDICKSKCGCGYCANVENSFVLL